MADTDANDWASAWELPDRVASTLEKAKHNHQLPPLEAFEMSGSTLDQSKCEQIPENLYRALACLFAFLFDAEEFFGEKQ